MAYILIPLHALLLYLFTHLLTYSLTYSSQNPLPVLDGAEGAAARLPPHYRTHVHSPLSLFLFRGRHNACV